MKKRKPPRLLPYLTRRIGLVLLSLWLVSMSLLTVGTAQFVLDDLTETGYDFPERAGGEGRLDEYFPALEEEQNESFRPEPGGMDYCMLSAVALSSLGVSAPSISHYDADTFFSGIFRQNAWTPLNTALLFVDNSGNILHQNGDFLYFYYMGEEHWAAQEDGIDGYAWIDLSDESDERYSFIRVQYHGVHNLFDWDTLRMTGYFDGTRFEPLSMALADFFDYHEGLDGFSPQTETNSTSEVTMAQLDAMGLIEWEERYDYTADAPADKELVTIYGRYPEMMLYDSESVRYQGSTYPDLVTLLAQMGYYRDKGSLTFHQTQSQISLWNTVIFGCRSYWNFTGYDPTANQPWPDAEITLMTAVQASPLRIAAGYLRNVYLLSAALVLVAFLWLRSLIKHHVSAPLQTVNTHMNEGWTLLPDYIHTPPKLHEVRELVGHYRSTQQQLYGCKNEITRLTTALHYAETAEENRRQMTSHIAHELKTPLAVIHSYTEGLQERIAEEKREHYLSVILSETERMDAMVLEMLDLSRLEAGRVKLSRDELSLQALCRSVLEKLDLALQAKELHVTYTCYCSDIVTADEGRIRQVMENFATNAIKHTPHGGEIRVRVTADRSGHTFAMENDGEKLPAEVLDKVWDSFWRQDESRSSPGTGLGLAIAKGIITLHGGTCTARNTKNGVEFSFRI